MSRQDDAGETEPATGPRRRQLLVLAVCVAGLVAAAFLAPTVGPSDGGPGGAGAGDQQQPGSGDEQSDGGSGGATPGDGQSDGSGQSERSQDGGGEISDEGAPIPVPGDDAPPVDGCAVVVEDEPVPGKEITVSVWRDLDPVEGALVRFDGDPIGRTDDDGTVTGRVPYSRSLDVSVAVDGDEPCGFYRRQFDNGSDRAAALAPSVSLPDRDAPAEVAGALTEVASVVRVSAASLATVEPDAPSVQSTPNRTGQSDANRTGSYAVRGSVNFSVRGDPYPGENVTVRATVKDVPMRDAAVRVDGERVGRTDERGRVTVRIPDDRSETVTVTVSRGDFAGSARIDVLLLSLDYEAQTFSIPGEPAAVNATVGGAPVSGASVRLDGRSLGATADDGTVSFRLPAALDRTVAVETERQSVARPLWPVYLPTILVSGLVVVFGTASSLATARAKSRCAGVRVAAAWAALAALLGGWIVWETIGFLAAVGALALAGVVYYRRTVASGAASAGGLLAAIGQWLLRTAFSVTDRLERVADVCLALLGRFQRWLDSLPRSASGLLARLAARILSIPRGILGALGRVARRLRAIRLSTVLGIALAVGVVAAATRLFGPLGLLGSLVLVAAFALAIRRRRGQSDASPKSTEDVTEGPTDRSPAAAVTKRPSPEQRSIRELWRRFARRVAPGRWRRRTPGEISRAAIERGFPETPVRTLARAFREVEYGGRSPSEARRDAAADAFDSLESEKPEDGEDR